MKNWRDECLRCTRCPDLSKRPVLGVGPQAPRLVLIGEAPGREEDHSGKPFVGSSGRILDVALRRAGISRSQVYITNAVKCRPPNNRPPTPKEVRNCFTYLAAELEELEPYGCLVPMGNTAFGALLDREADITTYRGSPTCTDRLSQKVADPVKVLPTLHPAFVMRQWLYSEVLAHDLRKAWRYGETPQYTAPPKAYFQPGDPEFQPYVDQLVGPKGFSFDIETTGLRPWSGQVLGIGFSNSSGTGVFYPLPQYREEVQALLSADCPKSAQFGTFDVFFLRWHGYNITRYEFDTKFAQNILCPELPSSLAFLSSIYTMYPYYKTWKGKEIRKDPGSVPQKVLAEYCIQDADATWQCAEQLRAELEQEEMMPLFT